MVFIREGGHVRTGPTTDVMDERDQTSRYLGEGHNYYID